MRFAGFIMTYHRPLILKDAIEKVFRQSFPPEKLLIVDNSDDNATKEILATMNNNRIEYLKVGYNSGPAGAAKIGLEHLANEGFDWIYWGDDDDAPVFDDAFEVLFTISQDSVKNKEIGILGAVGHYFDRNTGEISRAGDDSLAGEELLFVDSIAGNQTMLVNARVVFSGILPDERLFFGFEELDFCLRVKASGFQIGVSTELFKRSRNLFGKTNHKKSLYVIKRYDALPRQYYSTRNLLIILGSNNLYLAYFYQLVKAIVKSFYGFRFGWTYGLRNFEMLQFGLVDGIIRKSGKKY